MLQAARLCHCPLRIKEGHSPASQEHKELQKFRLQKGKEGIPQGWILILLSELLDIRSYCKQQQYFQLSIFIILVNSLVIYDQFYMPTSNFPLLGGAQTNIGHSEFTFFLLNLPSCWGVPPGQWHLAKPPVNTYTARHPLCCQVRCVYLWNSSQAFKRLANLQGHLPSGTGAMVEMITSSSTQIRGWCWLPTSHLKPSFCSWVQVLSALVQLSFLAPCSLWPSDPLTIPHVVSQTCT